MGGPDINTPMYSTSRRSAHPLFLQRTVQYKRLVTTRESSEILYNTPMTKDIVVDGDLFDAALARLLNAKPITKAEISARIKAEREAKKDAKSSK
jgi:hypothetical protein